MSDPEASRANTTAVPWLAGLLRNGWVLAAMAAALAGVYFWGQRSPLVPAAAFVFVAAVVVSMPHRVARSPLPDRGKAEAADVEALSSRELAAAISDPIVLFDASATVVHANAAATSAFGVIPGMPLLLKFRAPEMQALIEGALRSPDTPGAIDYVERIPMERLFRVSASGAGALFVLTFKDQSEVRRIDRMRADFIANASHELRTPLASIAGFVETLRGPARDDPAARERFLEIMQGQTGRMARLIDDLLSLSRLEMKPFASDGGKVDVRAVAESVIESLHPMASELGVEIEREFPDGRFEAIGDRDELFQVFENLVENACKYGQAGGRVVVSIRCDAKGASPEIDVTVRDFGPGIAAQHIPRITERFYRVDVATSRAQKGTGLGLSIVKHILTRHGARLSIASRPGEGAAFTVHLPAAA